MLILVDDDIILADQILVLVGQNSSMGILTYILILPLLVAWGRSRVVSILGS